MRLRKHLIIPDTQVKPGDNFDHLEWCGRYIVDKKPDVVIQLGDFTDMESLSSYDVGKKHHEGKRYKADIEATHAAMTRLMQPIWDYNTAARKNHHQRYNPELHLLYGNHEERILRAVESDAKLEGTMSLEQLGYEVFGWQTHPFLEVVTIDGVAYSHYFTSGIKGLPIISARALLTKKHMSCIAGHQPGRDIAYDKRADGQAMTAIIAGSFYPDGLHYLNSQTNVHWRGLYMLHEVKDGSFDEMAVSIGYLKRKYGGKK